MRPRTYAQPREQGPRGAQPPSPERRRALVGDVVARAVLPRLLARKDAGAFDRTRQAPSSACAPVGAEE
jgi:hypothetical protein